MTNEGAYPHAISVYDARLFRDGDNLSLMIMLECFGRSLDLELFKNKK